MPDFLQDEDGNILQTESGVNIELESSSSRKLYPFWLFQRTDYPFLQTESGEDLQTESGVRIDL